MIAYRDIADTNAMIEASRKYRKAVVIGGGLLGLEAANGLMLRNPGLINFLDGCALSLPCHPEGSAPVGLMVAGVAQSDRRILDIGLSLEELLASSRNMSL